MVVKRRNAQRRHNKDRNDKENKTHRSLFDLEIQTDHLIPARRPDSDN